MKDTVYRCRCSVATRFAQRPLGFLSRYQTDRQCIIETGSLIAGNGAPLGVLQGRAATLCCASVLESVLGFLHFLAHSCLLLHLAAMLGNVEKPPNSLIFSVSMAEREGFEPSVELPLHRFSKPAP